MGQTVKVLAEVDRMGNLILTPVGERFAWAVRRHRRAVGEHDSADLFFQEGMGAEEALDTLFTRREREELEAGYPVRFLMPVDDFLHFVGYDASSNVYESSAGYWTTHKAD